MRSLNNNIIKSFITKRELEIIELIAYEFSTKEIAQKLFIGFETVKTHRKNIQLKLGVKNVAGIVRVAFQKNILDLKQKLTIAS